MPRVRATSARRGGAGLRRQADVNCRSHGRGPRRRACRRCALGRGHRDRWTRELLLEGRGGGAGFRGSTTGAGSTDDVSSASSAEIGIWISCARPLVPSMMVMVLLRGAAAGELRPGRRWGDRRVTAGSREDRRQCPARHCCPAVWACAAASGALPADLSARNIHPVRNIVERPNAPATTCNSANVSFRGRLAGLRWPSGALRSSVITARIPRIVEKQSSVKICTQNR